MKVLDNSVPERVLDFSLPPTLTKGILIKKTKGGRGFVNSLNV